MQKHLKDLKPTEFGDLIAMNALYRPGPMEYIPSFIKRKHGVEEITYDLEDCEEYLMRLMVLQLVRAGYASIPKASRIL